MKKTLELAKPVASLAMALALGGWAGGAQAQLQQGRAPLDWMVMDLPPAQMPVDGKLTDGFVDTILKMLFAEMPEFEHRIVVTPIARSWAVLSEGAPMCFTTALITPERERMAYTTLTQLIPPLQLVVRSEAMAKLPKNDKGEVLPATLFDRADLRGLITPRRSYAATLDALLALRPAKSGVHEVVATGSGSNILQMLSMDRADYTIEYDYVLKYQQSRFPDSINQNLRVLPIAGAQPIPSGIACPHTEWGRKMIIRIDSILARISQRPEYQNAKQHWLSPETVKRYQKQEAEFFKRRAQPSDPAKYPVWPTPN